MEIDTTLITVDSTNNHNKFYRVRLEGDLITITYGRVGSAGRTTTKRGSPGTAQSILESKKRKGYREVDLVESTKSATEVDHAAAISALTPDDTETDPVVADLVSYLARANAHQITESTGGRIQVDSSGARTALGVIGPGAVVTARGLLDTIATATGDKRTSAVEGYLQIVPQKVPGKRGWAETLFTGPDELAAQYDLLDALESTIATATVDHEAAPLDFRYRLVSRPDLIEETGERYRRTCSKAHSSALLDADVTAVYALEEPGAVDLGGTVKRLWHGSRSSNILSILATGLRQPRPGDHHVTGAMFGPGIYFSDTSTKSAAYSRGGLWSSGVDSRWMMFLADAATGHEYRPNIHGLNPAWEKIHDGTIVDDRKGGRRFDSVNVKAGTCGVYHHEAVVWDSSRIRLRYLVEFSA